MRNSDPAPNCRALVLNPAPPGITLSRPCGQIAALHLERASDRGGSRSDAEKIRRRTILTVATLRRPRPVPLLKLAIAARRRIESPRARSGSGPARDGPVRPVAKLPHWIWSDLRIGSDLARFADRHQVRARAEQRRFALHPAQVAEKTLLVFRIGQLGDEIGEQPPDALDGEHVDV